MGRPFERRRKPAPRQMTAARPRGRDQDPAYSSPSLPAHFGTSAGVQLFMMMKFASLFLWLASCAAAPGTQEIILCGGDEVFIVDAREREPRKIWSWRAPEPLRDRFRSTDECKSMAGGRVLITSSSGGVALVERSSGRALFWAAVTNAHSAEALPRGRVVVAGSYGKGGNRLALFDLNVPEKEIWTDELHGAHGVVWDPKRELLWALGETELRAYRLLGWESATPSLERAWTAALPDRGGHDLYPVAGTALLTVTTGSRAWLFDRDRREFAPHPVLGDAAGVKCITLHPHTGRTAYVQAETSWWSSRVRFLDPAGELHLPGERLYKARWNVVPEEWRDLFNGRDLDNWEQIGTAKWRVEEGVISGGQEGDSKRSGFLTTKERFRDFELAFDFMIDEHGKYNSGVYLRNEPGKGGQTGYQVNIGRAAAGEFCGGVVIHKEGKVAWLAKGDEKDEARKKLEWNSMKILAKGGHLEVVLNGVKVSDCTHEDPPAKFLQSGVIAFQTYGAEGHAGWVKFRNLKVRELE